MDSSLRMEDFPSFRTYDICKFTADAGELLHCNLDIDRANCKYFRL